MAQSLPTKTREELLKRVLQQKIPVAQACRELGVSRFTFYKWLKRYQEGKELKDKPRQIRRFWRQATPEQEELVLKLVAKNPTLSKYGIAEKFRQMVDRPVLGTHGVYNVLRRWNLTLPEARLAYAQRERETVVARPVPWFNRLRLVWEQFIPSLVPAPPPQLKELAKAFLTPFAFASILGFLFLLWFQMLSGQSFSAQLGLFFATLSLTFGLFFFLYSFKYYFTLILILGFSRQVSGPEASLGGPTSQEIPLRGRTSLGNGQQSIWQRIFGFANHKNGRNGKENSNGKNGGSYLEGGLRPDLSQIKLQRHPFVSIHLPLYNEKTVVKRLLTTCTALDYDNYEVVVVDDSTDGTTEMVEEFAKRWNASLGGATFSGSSAEVAPQTRPYIKVIHRGTRKGYKGGALQVALKNTDPKTEFVIVFDADFIPYSDTITQFLKYFQATAGGLDFQSAPKHPSGVLRHKHHLTGEEMKVAPGGSNIAAVQGYQWHVLNKSENWITKGVRSEYAGSYVVERSGAEALGALKQIAGAVYMIRADLLRAYGWGTSITEDFELTLKLYRDGYKVVYTPYLQAPSECVSTLKRLIRQRMRWAEGHTHNIRKMFWELMWGRWEEVGDSSALKHPSGVLRHKHHLTGEETGKTWVPSRLTLMEKLEFLYLSPYYLQAAFFMLGTFSWFLSEAIFQTKLPFWTSLWGWSLVLTNLFALPLMNTVGLFLEESEEKDYIGILSFIFLTYLLVPFQAYAAVKGFLEPKEGPWFRTPKTGKITDIFTPGRFARFISGIFPGRRPAVVPAAVQSFTPWSRHSGTLRGYLALAPSASLGAGTANNRFENFFTLRKRTKWIGRISLVALLILSTLLLSLAPAAPYFVKPQETQAKAFGMLAGPQGNLTQTRKSINGAYPNDSSNFEELKPKEISPSAYAFKTLDDNVIEIGTEKHSPPQPYLKLDKWDGEVSLKVGIPFETGEKPTVIGDKIKYSTADKEEKLTWRQRLLSNFSVSAKDSQPRIDIEFYPREPEEITETDTQGNEHKFTINEQGGVEFDTILYERPNTNQIIFPIETKGLKFYYQPELTQEEKDRGAFRPENVVGSYAVYHRSKQGDYSQMGGKNYRTGKAFHIYRPKVTDAAGKEIWGELKIDEQAGTLTITIDQNWLDNAVYPVTIDPNFGYETAGASTDGNLDSTLNGSLFTSPTNVASANSLTFYGRRQSSGTVNWKGVIVLHTDLTILTNGVGSPVAGTGTSAWLTSSFATSPSLSPSTDYVLMAIADSPIFLNLDAGVTNQGHQDGSNNYTTPTNPTDASHNTRKFSIYATYSAKIDTSTSANATAYSFQRKTWYDGTRLWSAFYSGTEIEFWYSADWGATWTQNTSATISVSTNDFSIEADTADAFITYTNGYDIEARSATTYPGTGFGWSAATIVYDGSSINSYFYPALTRDSNNKVWITTTNLFTSTFTYTFRAIQSTNANDISAWGTATTLDSSANSNKYGTIVPSGTGEVYAVWIDATTIEGKEYTSSTWAGSPTTIATGVTGLTNNMSAVSDSSGNVHLLYINSSDYAVYQEYTTSWQTAVTLDSTAGNDYPTISLNTSNNDLYALWIRSNVIYYKKGVSPYASANWDASATSWKSTGTNAWVTSNYSGAGMIFAQWTEGTGSPYSVMWDYIIIPEKLWFLLGLGLIIPGLLKTRLRHRLRRAREE